MCGFQEIELNYGTQSLPYAPHARHSADDFWGHNLLQTGLERRFQPDPGEERASEIYRIQVPQRSIWV